MHLKILFFFCSVWLSRSPASNFILWYLKMFKFFGHCQLDACYNIFLANLLLPLIVRRSNSKPFFFKVTINGHYKPYSRGAISFHINEGERFWWWCIQNSRPSCWYLCICTMSWLGRNKILNFWKYWLFYLQLLIQTGPNTVLWKWIERTPPY